MTVASLSLEGKIALVTGARRGIGKAIALGFAGSGADVAICDSTVDDGKLEAVAAEIKQTGRRSVSIHTDVSSKSDVDSLIESVEREIGPIDILVNNAGIGGGAAFPDTPEEVWDRVMAINLKGVYLCSQAACGGMTKRESGVIVNIASMGGLMVPTRGRAYNVSKAGVIMFTKALAYEVGKYNIRVNAIAPGVVQTDMSLEAHFKDAAAIEAELREVRLPRLATADDIVGPVLFLASEASGYITGQTLVVDGGKSLD